MIKKLISALYLSYENAKSLYSDALLLGENKRFGRSYSLYHLSFEECGRFFILHNIFHKYLFNEIHPREITYKFIKQQGYEDHERKISRSFEGIREMSLVYLSIARGQAKDEKIKIEIQSDMDKFDSLFEKIIQDEKKLNNLKNVGLYVVYQDDEFKLPDHTITTSEYFTMKELASLSLKSVQRMIDFAKAKGGFEKFKEQVDQ
jgi:AbiV family abortive infection protein